MTTRTNLSETDPEALSIDAFSARYGVCVTNTYALIRDGKLRAVKYGRRTLIPAEAAREWLASLPAYRAPGARFGHVAA